MWSRKQIYYTSVLTYKGPRLLLLALFIQLAVPSLLGQWMKSTLFDDSDMAQDLAEAYSFQKYPTYQQYLEMMQAYALDYPAICKLDTIGKSSRGRLLLALKISDQVRENEAEASFLYTSTMHGDEIVGYVLLLRLADTLLKGYGSDPEITALVEGLQIWINPLANPDGSFDNDHNESLVHAIRTNKDRVDLNRDFPAPNAGEADDTTGRAIENRHMMEFMRTRGFTLSANLHAGEEVVNYPWDKDSSFHADDPWYRFISREYADEARAVDPGYMALFTDGITHGAYWYVAKGTRQDYANYYLEGREVTLELSLEKLLPSEELEHHWNVNRRSLINYMSQCLYGIRGTVRDQESGQPLRAKIFVEHHDSAYSAIHSDPDHGDFYRLIKEGVYDLVVSAPGYFSDTIRSVSVTDFQATNLNLQLKAYGLPVLAEKTPAFRIYPNPAVHSFRVDAADLPGGVLEVLLYTMDGRLILHEIRHDQGSGIELYTGHIEEGIYLLRCTSGNYSEVHRLVVLK